MEKKNNLYTYPYQPMWIWGTSPFVENYASVFQPPNGINTQIWDHFVHERIIELKKHK